MLVDQLDPAGERKNRVDGSSEGGDEEYGQVQADLHARLSLVRQLTERLLKANWKRNRASAVYPEPNSMVRLHCAANLPSRPARTTEKCNVTTLHFDVQIFLVAVSLLRPVLFLCFLVLFHLVSLTIHPM